MTAQPGPAPGAPRPEFAVRVHGPRRIPPGGGDVHAVVRIARTPPAPSDGPATAADVALRLWTPRGTRVAALVQIAPRVCDITGRRGPCDPRTGAYPAGAWADETRTYHLHLRVPPAKPGRRMRAARLRVLAAGSDPHTAACGDVLAEWTREGDAALVPAPAAGAAGDGPTRAAPYALHTSPETDTATVRLGRAVAPAHARTGTAAEESTG
ncbi:hypothetical protein ACFFN5_23355, partial [Streptomonospora salina]